MFRDDLKAALYQQSRLTIFLETVRPYRECCETDALEAFNYCGDVCHRIWSEEHRTPDARERLQLVVNRLSVPLPDDLLNALARRCGELVYDFPPTLIEGVAEALAKLSSEYKLAVISDTGYSPGSVLRELMRRNNIFDYFHTLTFSDEVGRSKPHESVFRRTAEALNVRPAEVLHIGDLEMTDVAGAKAFGAMAALFAPGFYSRPASKADFVVKSHYELLERLAELDQNLAEAVD